MYRRLPATARAELREYAKSTMRISMDSVASIRRMAADPSGFVYIITNPAYPGFVKIGMAVNPHGRLKGYQTSSPFRDYKLEAYVWVSDRRAAESVMFDYLETHRVSGEWFNVSIAFAKFVLGTVKEEFL